MLDTKRIPLGKLKQAFALNEQDVETLIAALWPPGVWGKGYCWVPKD